MELSVIGFFGTIKLTKHIILTNFSHFLCIALIFIIPYAFDLTVFDMSSLALDTLVTFTYPLYVNLIASIEQQLPSLALPLDNINNSTTPLNNTSVDPSAIPQIQLPPLSPLILHFIFSIIVPFLSNPLLTFAVCRACLNKSPNLKLSLMRGIPRSAKNLAYTSLCMGAVLVGYCAMAIGLLGIIAGVLVVVNAKPVTATVIGGVLSGMSVGGVYVATTLSLAHTVAMLEEKKGWEAMGRSMALLDGTRKWQALGLAGLFFGISRAIEEAVKQWKYWARGAGRVVGVGLVAWVAMFGMAAHVVLYMSCKSRRKEPLHTLVAATPEFGPHEYLPKSTDLEATAPFFHTAL